MFLFPVIQHQIPPHLDYHSKANPFVILVRFIFRVNIVPPQFGILKVLIPIDLDPTRIEKVWQKERAYTFNKLFSLSRRLFLLIYQPCESNSSVFRTVEVSLTSFRLCISQAQMRYTLRKQRTVVCG